MSNDTVKLEETVSDLKNQKPALFNKFSPKRKYDDDTIRGMLSCLEPDMEYHSWVRVGMALHDGGYPLHLWDEWSKQGKKYDGSCKESWNSFSEGNGVSIGSLIHMAKENGWKGNINYVPSKQDRLKPIAWEEMDQLPKREYLIKKLLDKGAMSTVFGESNSGKTFLAIDIAAHVALGKQWNGIKTNVGAVVYIAAEGGFGLTERLKAFYSHNNLKNYPPLYIIPTGIDLCNSQADAENLIYEIQQIRNVQLVVIDTLSRAMAGGNENSPDDMGAFLKNCDQIREMTKAHVMLIHHSGKDASRGARGHSSLKAAVDTEIVVKQADNRIVTAEVTKQRDGATGIKYAFKLHSVSLGQDEDGDLRTSCVLISTELTKALKRLKGQKLKAFEVLQELLISHGQTQRLKPDLPAMISIPADEFREALKKAKITKADKPDDARRVISKVITDLVNAGFISVYKNQVWIPDISDKSEIPLAP